MVDTTASNVLNDRYILHEKLAEGGMGIVYRATDKLTGYDVALKQVKLKNSPGDDHDTATAADSLRERNALALEFRAVASIRHPNIISVLDFGFLDDGAPFFTMDYLEEFRDFVAGGNGKTVDEKIDMLVELLNTLEYLHLRGLLHRDIKPGNVAYYRDTVKLLDFGLSIEQDNVESNENEVVGTIAYMAPEVLQGMSASPSSDVFAVGIMAHELFTGEHPFGTENIGLLIQRLMTEKPNLSSLDTIYAGSISTEVPDKRGTQATTTVVNTLFDPADMEETTVFDAVTEPLTVDTDAFEADSPQYTDDTPLLDQNPLRVVIERMLEKTVDTRYTRAIEVVQDLNNKLQREALDESELIRESYLQSARFVGRQEEVSILQDALEDAKTGKGSAWLIAGETGVGKTRLVDELRILALIRGFTTVRGHALSDNSVPYQLWRDPVRRMTLHTPVPDVDASILKDIINDIERLLDRPVADPESVDGDKHRERIQAAILNLFNDISFPLLVILEDIHWDTSSVDTLSRLATIVQGKPILLIATYRQHEAPELTESLSDYEHMVLDRLDQHDIATLSESIIGRIDYLDQVTDMLYRQTDGNVYFVIEILRELAEKTGGLRAITRASLAQELSSVGIIDILRQRLKKLSSDELDLLKMMALAGGELNLQIARQIEDNLNVDDWLVLCSNLSMVDTSDDGQWKFIHDAMRRTVLDAIDDDEAPNLYRRLATAVESIYGENTEYATILAYHWRYANDHQKERQYARIGADYALHIGNLSEARELYDRLLELDDEQDTEAYSTVERSQIEIALVKTLQFLGEYEAALEIIAQTVENLRDSGHEKLLADALIEQGEVNKRQGNLALADRLVQDALDKLTALGDQRRMIYAMDRLSDIRYEEGDYATASEIATNGLALATELNDRIASGSLLNNLGMIAFAKGEFETARENFTQAKEIYSDTGQQRAVATFEMNLGSVAGASGDLESCLASFTNALDVFKSIGDKRLIGITYNNLGLVTSMQGNFLDSIAYYEESLKIARSIGNLGEICVTLLHLGDALLEFGGHEQAKTNFGEALQLSTDASMTPIILQCFSHLVKLFDGDAFVPVIIGHVINHSATNQETRERCDDVMAQLKETYDDNDLNRLLEQGQAQTTQALVDHILTKLKAM